MKLSRTFERRLRVIRSRFLCDWSLNILNTNIYSHVTCEILRICAWIIFDYICTELVADQTLQMMAWWQILLGHVAGVILDPNRFLSISLSHYLSPVNVNSLLWNTIIPFSSMMHLLRKWCFSTAILVYQMVSIHLWYLGCVWRASTKWMAMQNRLFSPPQWEDMG